MTLTQLPASTTPLAPYFRNVFLEGSELFHITQLVIKSHNKLFPSFLHNFQAAPPMSRSSLFALFVTAVLSFPCVCVHTLAIMRSRRGSLGIMDSHYCPCIIQPIEVLFRYQFCPSHQTGHHQGDWDLQSKRPVMNAERNIWHGNFHLRKGSSPSSVLSQSILQV